MKKYNLNDSIVIYPNEKGWIKLKEVLIMEYKFKSEDKLNQYLILRTTEDGGFKEQLWEIMSLFGKMFYNGTSYFETSFIDLCNER